ncbi:hypothetical protein SDC9_162098 [bioreactor metagenome]|uniref:Uncharacterized protein n=1 Tax=bioreactor metagenome TaxID=1076179 RepID=A0A645FN57_9ZZZZ
MQLVEHRHVAVEVVVDDNPEIPRFIVPGGKRFQVGPDRITELLIVTGIAGDFLRDNPVIVLRARAEAAQVYAVDLVVCYHHSFEEGSHPLQAGTVGTVFHPASRRNMGKPHNGHLVASRILQVRDGTHHLRCRCLEAYIGEQGTVVGCHRFIHHLGLVPGVGLSFGCVSKYIIDRVERID